jgi:hypothetical protein
MEKTKKQMEKYFTQEEIDEIKESSLKFPYFIYDESPDKITEVIEVVSISGMTDNNGTPTEIVIYKTKKGEETEKLIYKLEKNK